MKNKYIKGTHLSERKFKAIMKLFAAENQASQISLLTNTNRNTINRILNKTRNRIKELAEKESIFSKGEVEIDESYFGARRIKGKRGRGAYGKIKVFGLKKRDGNVYTQIVNNCSVNELYPIIAEKVTTDNTIYSDEFRTYDGLVNFGYKKHYRVKHSKDNFANGKAHINGIENFWGIAKVRLSKFRGMSKKTFYLHLKETEFRFNHRNANLYMLLLREFRTLPL